MTTQIEPLAQIIIAIYQTVIAIYKTVIDTYRVIITIYQSIPDQSPYHHDASSI